MVSHESSEDAIIVAVRIRPPTQSEIIHDQGQSCIKCLDDKILVFDPLPEADDGGDDVLKPRFSKRYKNLTYGFDVVFDEDSTQEDVYRRTVFPLIESTLCGYNCSVFAYGATGSGKTHTMVGNTVSGMGVMGRAMNDLFSQMEDKKLTDSFNITVSYMEIYNEQIRDLLTNEQKSLDLMEDPVTGICVAGISKHHPSSADEVMKLLQYGNTNRSVSATNANEHSSRSHAVMQITVHGKNRTCNITETVRVGKLSLIDLAGSERAAATLNRGDRMREGANINKSLLALGNCINALAVKSVENTRSHIPYRDSKLTRLLKDSLGGNCRTVMLAAVSPSFLSVEDTHNTLKYANRAKDIQVAVATNEKTVENHISHLIESLRAQVVELQNNLNVERASHAYLTSQMGNFINDDDMLISKKIRTILTAYIKDRDEVSAIIANVKSERDIVMSETNNMLVQICQWRRYHADHHDELPIEIANLLETVDCNNISKKKKEDELIILSKRANAMDRKMESLMADASNIQNNDLRERLVLEIENCKLKVNLRVEKYEVERGRKLAELMRTNFQKVLESTSKGQVFTGENLATVQSNEHIATTTVYNPEIEDSTVMSRAVMSSIDDREVHRVSLSVSKTRQGISKQKINEGNHGLKPSDTSANQLKKKPPLPSLTSVVPKKRPIADVEVSFDENVGAVVPPGAIGKQVGTVSVSLYDNGDMARHKRGRRSTEKSEIPNMTAQRKLGGGAIAEKKDTYSSLSLKNAGVIRMR